MNNIVMKTDISETTRIIIIKTLNWCNINKNEDEITKFINNQLIEDKTFIKALNNMITFTDETMK